MDKQYLNTIAESELFSPDWYMEKYPEVKTLGISPAEHYLRFGFRLSYDPSPNFSTEQYYRANEDVRATNMPALLHYELNGKDEGRGYRKIPPNLAILQASLVKPDSNRRYLEIDLSLVSVIVPVYNGHNHLKRLLPRLLKNTSADAEIIIINDASDDVRVTALLKEYEYFPNIRLLENTKNLGFTGTVNKAASHARRHFCILNSDTDVPSLWIERLMEPILRNETEIASSTPFSNSATIFSFPEWLTDNQEATDIGVDELDEMFKQNHIAPGTNLSCPTGVGFCMGINGQLWRRIGGFDEAAFGKGYGEENDWCQRAISYGFRNVLVPNLYVLHAHGGSFPTEEKAKLIAKNSQILNERWPNYDEQIQKFIRANEWNSIRSQIIGAYAAKSQNVVIFDHGLGGGANSYSNANKQKRTKEGKSVFRIFFDQSLHMFIVEVFALKGFAAFSCSSYKDLFLFLNTIDLHSIEVNNLVGWPDLSDLIPQITHLIKSKNAYSRFLLHDFFSVCTSYTLINDLGNFCGVPSDENICAKCIQSNKHSTTRTSPFTWRENWRPLFNQCDEIISFSPSSRDHFLKAYSDFAEKVVIIPHQPIGHLRKAKIVKTTKNIVGVVGNLSYAKGASVLQSLIKWTDEEDIDCEFVILGEVDPAFGVDSNRIKHKSGYQRHELPDLLEKYNVNCCLVPSICPETFSYVTQELIMMNVPIVCFDLGGQADQVRQYKNGITIKGTEPSELWLAITSLTASLGIVSPPTPTA